MDYVIILTLSVLVIVFCQYILFYIFTFLLSTIRYYVYLIKNLFLFISYFIILPKRIFKIILSKGVIKVLNLFLLYFDYFEKNIISLYFRYLLCNFWMFANFIYLFWGKPFWWNLSSNYFNYSLKTVDLLLFDSISSLYNFWFVNTLFNWIYLYETFFKFLWLNPYFIHIYKIDVLLNFEDFLFEYLFLYNYVRFEKFVLRFLNFSK